MMPKKWALLGFLMMIGFLSACSGNPAGGALTVAEVQDHMQQEVDFSGMKLQDADKLRKWYGIEPGILEDFVLYTATSNVKADELAILKVKDIREIATVMEQIEQRIQAQAVKFKDYRPEEYYLIEKHVLKSKGAFVFFAVSEQVEGMEAAYDAAWTSHFSGLVPNNTSCINIRWIART